MVALVPTLIAFAIDTWVLAQTGSRWLLMIAAVIVSAANGGMVSGLVATIASASLVWWFLIPPRETFGAADPIHYLSAAIFVLIAFAVTVLHERLRRTTEHLARAARTNKEQRDQLEQANERLSSAMRDLTQSQRNLQGVLDHSPNGIVIKTTGGRYTMVSNGFAAIAGLTREAATGRTDPDLFPPQLAERLQANDQRVMATNQPVATEETIEHNGQRRVFLVTKFPLRAETGAVVALCAIWTEITQRKLDEEALRRVANDLRVAQRVAHVGSWRWDVRTGQSEWSDELYRILGEEPRSGPAPLLLDPDSHILTEESFKRLRAAMDRALADGSPYDLDLEFRRRDGSLGWVSARGEAVRDDAGHIIAINGTSADITKIKELQRLRDEWTSIIAHDLRQPIGTILMASGILPELAGEMNDDARAMVQRIHTASLALKRLVDDLLDMSLLEAKRLKLECKWSKPSSLVRETIQQLGHLPGIDRVQVADGGEAPDIFVDPMRIEQVLANLVSNAIKYGDAGTPVTVRVAQHEQAIEFLVTNHGRGIAAEDLPKLFGRFVRSNTTRGTGVRGLGLGLYIARGVVDAHGGRIWAESTPGKETTFHVLLPGPLKMHDAA